eukprot:552476_1
MDLRLILFYGVLFFCIQYVNSQYCLDKQECEGQTINLATLYCGGYFACTSATIATQNGYFRGFGAANGAIIKAYNKQLNAYMLGYKSGENADIICKDGDTCYVECDGKGCLQLKFYCYSGATCKYDCSEDPNACPELIGGVNSGLTDPQIYQMYLENQKKKKVIKPDFDFVNNNDDYKPSMYTVSLTQLLGMVISCLFLGISIGLFFWNAKSLSIIFCKKAENKQRF